MLAFDGAQDEERDRSAAASLAGWEKVHSALRSSTLQFAPLTREYALQVGNCRVSAKQSSIRRLHIRIVDLRDARSSKRSQYGRRRRPAAEVAQGLVQMCPSANLPWMDAVPAAFSVRAAASPRGYLNRGASLPAACRIVGCILLKNTPGPLSFQTGLASWRRNNSSAGQTAISG